MKRRLSACVGFWLAVPGGQVQAEEPWRFQVTPYIWGAGLSGDVQPIAALPSVGVNKSFGDLLEDLDAAFFINGTVRKDRFLLFGDFTYASLSESHTLNIRPSPLLPTFHFPTEVKVSQATFTLAAGYSVVKEPNFVLDLLGGMRGWSIKASVNVQHNLPFLPTSASESRFWVDPIVGARARYQFAPRWSVIGYADVGGFGAGSQHTWQVAATINYQVSNWFFLSAGYRHMAVRYNRNGLDLNIHMSGPLVGATLRF